MSIKMDAWLKNKLVELQTIRDRLNLEIKTIEDVLDLAMAPNIHIARLEDSGQNAAGDVNTSVLLHKAICEQCGQPAVYSFVFDGAPP